MEREPKADLGVVGMAVMGRSLAMNALDHGYRVAVWNRTPAVVDDAVAESGGRLVGAASLADLVARLDRPRRVLIMVKAGAAVDAVLADLGSLLEPGDVVIDGGNSWFEDTRRRERELADGGIRFLGLGVSGGEEGARHGPSLMPGGDAEAYALVLPLLEAIAARSAFGPCVAHVGPGGAGHFVKMVHNGIEYADMQLIAEAYHLLRSLGGMGPPALAETFAAWSRGPLESFLVEITARIFAVPDGDGWLVDRVLDKAGQKGTGRWTAKVALDLAVPVPSIAAAIDARVLSSMKAARVAASELLRGPTGERPPQDPTLAEAAHDALLASKVVAYAQGLALIRAASDEHGWGVDLRQMARIWTGGCIIRARLLGDVMRAYEERPDLGSLLLDPDLCGRVDAAQEGWRRVVAAATARGIPVPAMAASLAYYDGLRSAWLPQGLTQAQRDAFGAHTYQRNDAPDPAPFVHSDWLG